MTQKAALGNDFPGGQIADTLMRVRETIRAAFKGQPGVALTGCGLGCGAHNELGAADVDLVVSGTKVHIHISIPKD